jgi:hypothetical protein
MDINNLINSFNKLNIESDSKYKINDLIEIIEDKSLNVEEKIDKINKLFITLLNKSKCYVNQNIYPNYCQ